MGEHLVRDGALLDGRLKASSILFEGMDPRANGSAAPGSQLAAQVLPGDVTRPLFAIVHGAPPVVFRWLDLQGSVLLNASSMGTAVPHSVEHCRFTRAGDSNAGPDGTRPLGGAIEVHAGSLSISASAFTNLTAQNGGALALAGPEATVVVAHSLFVGNRALLNGGAIHVGGGRLTLSAVSITRNLAGHKGGGLFLVQGLIFMTEGSQLAANAVSQYRCDGGFCGASYYIVDRASNSSAADAGSTGSGIFYALPAPPASYITTTSDCRHASADVYPHLCGPVFRQYPELDDAVVSRVEELAYDEQYPFACAPGLYGRSGYVDEQRTAICSGRCPAGHYCPSGTTDPVECQPGTFCEEGSPRPTFCPGGTYSPAWRLVSPRGCHRVKAGFYAPRGSVYPRACPSAGFKCPGAWLAEQDTWSSTRAAEPIPVSLGSTRVVINTVVEVRQLLLSFHLRLGAHADGGSVRSTIGAVLASYAGVPPELLVVSQAEGASRQMNISVSFRALTSVVTFEELERSLMILDSTSLHTILAEARIAATAGRRRMMDTVSISEVGLIRVDDAATVELMMAAEVDRACPAGHWCREGVQVACPIGSYNELEGAMGPAACNECPGFPELSTTYEVASTLPQHCVCETGHYNRNTTGGVDCQRCRAGTDCVERGTAMTSIPVKPGYFRITANASYVKRCPDAAANCNTVLDCPESNSGCRGGNSVADQCAPSLTGIFCLKCVRDPTKPPVYYSPATKSEVASCKTCDDGISVVVRGLISLIVLATLLAMGMMVYRFGKSVWQMERFGKRLLPERQREALKRVWFNLNLTVKIKIIFAFFQIVTKISRVYEVDLPPIVRELLESCSTFVTFGVNFAPRWLSCFGWGDDYVGVLRFWMAAPVVIVCMILVTSAGLLLVARRLTLTRLITYALPGTLRALFIIYPLVTAVAFDAYPCYSFADEDVDERRWLKIDVEVECDSAEHESIRWNARAALILYPIGLLVLIGSLLMAARKDILSLRKTTLSTATAFLHKDYEPHMFWWELVEMGRKLILVGFMIIVPAYLSSMLQLILGTLVSAIFLFVQLIASPYENQSDDYLAATASFSILVFFLSCLGYKYASAFDLAGIKQAMTLDQQNVYAVDTSWLTAFLLASIFASLVMTCVIFFLQLGAETVAFRREERVAKARRLRYVQTGLEVTPPAIDAGAFHVFLSHTWAQGQSDMRIVKHRLLEMMPDLRVFLDVDDLMFGAGQEYIERSYVVLTFCTAKYFKSKACAREVFDTVLNSKPIICVLEPERNEEKGGLSQQEISHLLLNKRYPEDDDPNAVVWPLQWKLEDEVKGWGFEGPPTGQQVVDALFAFDPVEWNRFSAFQDVTMRLIAQRVLWQSGSAEPSPSRASPLKMVSKRVAPEVHPCQQQAVYVQGEIGNGAVSIDPPKTKHHLYCSPSCAGASSLATELTETLQIDLQWTDELEMLESCDHMLLYLTSQTWTCGEMSERCAGEVRTALARGVHLLLAHEFPSAIEDDGQRGACAFHEFFNEGWTPKDLLVGDSAIYNQIATALKAGAWRRAGLVLLASKLRLNDDDASRQAPKIENKWRSIRSLSLDGESVDKKAGADRGLDECASCRDVSLTHCAGSSSTMTNQTIETNDDESFDIERQEHLDHGDGVLGVHQSPAGSQLEDDVELDTVESLSALAVQRTSSIERQRQGLPSHDQV